MVKVGDQKISRFLLASQMNDRYSTVRVRVSSLE